jgi:Esterase-like activity of phytase
MAPLEKVVFGKKILWRGGARQLRRLSCRGQGRILGLLIMPLLMSASHVQPGALNKAAAPFQFVKSWSLDATAEVDRTPIGGLSGCAKVDDWIYFVSDDRRGVDGARLFSFKWRATDRELILAERRLQVISKSERRHVLDLEGIGYHDGQFLFSNEGDANKKPRQPVEIFSVTSPSLAKKETLALPENLRPNPTGEQHQGLQNNQGFEGLVVDKTGGWAALSEGPPWRGRGEKSDHLIFLKGVLKPLRIDRRARYPLPDYKGRSDKLLLGVTELLDVTDREYLVLERGVELSSQGLKYDAQLCLANLPEQGDLMQRHCPYQFGDDKELMKNIQSTHNFEGLCWVDEARTHFLVVADNNFSKSENTLFLLFKVN